MRKSICLLFLTFFYSYHIPCEYKHLDRIIGETTSKSVYICTGPKYQCYHSHSRCRGLNSCSAEIKAVSQEKAVEMGRRPCKICY